MTGAATRRLTGRWVEVAAGALLAVQLVLRAVVGLRGYYFLDDFAFTGRAMTHRLTDPSFLLEPYNSHLMPGSFAWVWLLTRATGFHFAVVVVVDLALQLLLGWLFYRLLRSLFGARPLVLLPLAVLALSPITLPAFAWWAAAVNQLPMQLALVLVLLAHTAYLRSGSVRQGLLGPLALLGGLQFSEKSLFVLPVVAGVTLLWFTAGGPWRRVRTAVSRHRRVWLGYLVVAVPYAVLYVVHVPSPTRSGADVGSVTSLLARSVTHALAPGLLGGPWTWRRVGIVGGAADPGSAARVVALAVVGAVVLLTVLLHRRAWRAWALLAAYVVMNGLVVATSRATFIGPLIGDEYRYVTDVAVVAALALALATMPVVGDWAAAEPQPVERRDPASSAGRHLGGRALRRAGPPKRTRPRRLLLAAAVVGLVASSTVSTLRYDRYWHDNPARSWVDTAASQLRAAPPGTVLADVDVPDAVAWPLLGTYARTSVLLSPLHPPVRYLAPGQPATDLRVLDATGHLRPAGIAGEPVRHGPGGDCAWRIGTTPVTMPLATPVVAWTSVVRIGYIASADASAVVQAGDTFQRVHFTRGLGVAFLQVGGTVSSVQVSATDGDVTICTDDVVVGAPVPLPAPAG